MKKGIFVLTICLVFLSCTKDGINDLFESSEIKNLERIDIQKRSDYYSITFLDCGGATINVECFDENKPSNGLPPIGRHRKKVLNYFLGGVYGSEKAKKVQ